MIQEETRLSCTDNTGAKELQCIRVLGGNKKRYGRIGDIITCSVKKAVPFSAVKKGEVVHVVIVRQRKEIRRKDGTHIRFDDNAGVIIDKETKEPKGTRIFGPVPREMKHLGYTKIASLAPEVL